MLDLNVPLDEFDRLWRQGRMPRIDRFLAQYDVHHDQRVELLRELVAIDMEYRWRRSDADEPSKLLDTVIGTDADTSIGGVRLRPTLSDYVREWPELIQANSTPVELIAEEYRIRHRWGDRPTAEEYLGRFGDTPALRETLEGVRRELRLDEEHVGSTTTPLDPSVAASSEAFEYDPSGLRNIGRYRLLERLGQGGMAEVWLAEDSQLERRVALKMPRMDNASPQLRQRFVLEAKAAANLRHPGICPVFDAGEFEGQPFLTMAFIEGETLAMRCRRGAFRSPAEVASLLAQIARAMQVAHEAGIVHRDLKPSNVMVDPGGNAVVMDFGLAYRATTAEGTERLTHSGDTLGSPAYMSPEQVDGRLSDMGPATDIYSLGVILFEGLTGRLPFTGSPGGIMTRIARDEPPAPSSLAADVDPELEQLCLSMLAKDPARRPASMADVADCLTAIGRRLESGVPSTSPQEAPKRKSRRVALAVLCIAALAAVLGGILFSIQTPYGEVAFEIDPEAADNIQVNVLNGGQVVKVADAASGWSLQLKEGEYEFAPGKGETSFSMTPRVVRVSRGETEIVKVVVTPRARADVTSGGAPPRRKRMALEFADAKARVEVSPVKLDFTQPFTMESWVTPYADFASEVDSRVVAFVGDLLLKFKTDSGRWEFLARDYFLNQGVMAAPSPRGSVAYGQKVHLAAQWDGERLRLFVDGEPCAGEEVAVGAVGDLQKFIRARLASTNDSSRKWSTLVLGRHPFQASQPPGAGGIFGGTIESFRLSRKARYDGAFEPGELKADDATVLLYDFHEGEGDVLHDLSGNGYDGKIIAAKWVEADRPTPRASPKPVVPDLALEFDGIDDHVITPVVYDGSHPLTVEAWIAAADPWENGLAISNRDQTGFSLGQYVHDQNPVWQGLVFARQEEPAVIDLFAQPARGPRHHLALVWDGDTCRMFVNGNQWGWHTTPLAEMPGSDRPILLGTKWAGTDIDRYFHKLFAGLIDEIRISRTARYSQRFSPPSRFEPDEETLALYHCDEAEGDVLRDASGLGNHATIVGATRVPATRMFGPGPYYDELAEFLAETARPMPRRKGPALEFLRGEARVEIPPVDLDFTEPFTLECWATPDGNYQTYSHGRHLVMTPGLSLKLHSPANLWMLLAWSETRSAEVSTMRGHTVSFDHRTHFAAQWDGERLQLFLNGRLCPGQEFARGTFDRLKSFLIEQLAMLRSAPLLLGNHPADDWEQVGDRSHAFGGTIDGFRISRGVRYQKSFEPPSLTADETTVLLYDFSEGEGDVLHDRSGNGYDGKIIGAAWQPAPAATSPLPGLVGRPAELEGVRRWQIDTRWPRAELCIQQYSPDGKAYAVGSEDGYLRILAGGPRGDLLAIGHIDANGHPFGFDWAPDSQKFVTASTRTIQTWSLEGQPLERWSGDVEAVAWSPDGKWIAGSSPRGVVQLWRPDGTPGRVLRLSSHSRHSGVSWAPDSRQLVAFSGSTVVIGTPAGELVRTLPTGSGVRHVEWSPAGERIALVTWEGSVEIWGPSGRRLRQNRYEHRGPQSWGWSPDGQFIALSTGTQCALWDRDGRLVWEVPSPQYHPHHDGTLAWSPDSEQILVAKRDRGVLIHRMQDGSVAERIVEEAPRISGVAWSGRRQLWTASAFADRPLRLFGPDGMPTGPFLPEKCGSYDVAWDAAGESVLVADGWNIRRFAVSPEKELLRNAELLVSGTDYRLVATHPSDDLIAIASHGGSRSIIDGTGREVVRYEASDLSDLAFSPDGKWVAGTDGEAVLLWDGETADWTQRKVASEKPHEGIAWSSDSLRIATGTNRNTVAVYALDGQLLRTIEVHPTANLSGSALARSPDDRWITWSRRSLDYAVQAVDLETGRVLEFDRHVGHVADATWIAPDQILTGGEDGLLAAWDVSRGECLWTMLYRHQNEEGDLQAVTLSPQGAVRHADGDAAETLVYVVEREPGRLEIFSKSRFEKEFPAAATLADE